MTIKEAHKILHPDTTRKALEEIRYHAGFKSREEEIKKVGEACIVACEALEKQMGKKPIWEDGFIVFAKCPICKELLNIKENYCEQCGQKLDWE